jgi:hypothetical protein
MTWNGPRPCETIAPRLISPIGIADLLAAGFAFKSAQRSGPPLALRLRFAGALVRRSFGPPIARQRVGRATKEK